MSAFVIQTLEEEPEAPATFRPDQLAAANGQARVIGPFYDTDRAESWCRDSLASGRLAGTREFIIEAREVGYDIEAKLEPDA